MLNYFEPNKIFSITSKAPKYILFIFIVVISVGLLEALVISPEDYIQSDSVRIMYVHVPSAWISLGTFSIIAILSVITLVFKNKFFPLIAKSLAPSGLVFNIIALVTGSIWGKPTWGTWWAWDARITSMIVLCIFYILLILSHKLIEQEDKANKVSNIIAIIGLINVPIIKYSVDWWNTLHQPASIKLDGTSTIHSSMLLPLMLMLLVLLLYCALILLMKYKTEIIRIKKKNIKRI